MCKWSWNLGASTSWNPQGLSRLEMGLPYLLPQTIYTGPVVQESITELQCWSCDGTALHPNVMVSIQAFLNEGAPNSLTSKAFWGYSPSQFGTRIFVQDSVLHL